MGGPEAKIDVNKEIADFLESMLSPAWFFNSLVVTFHGSSWFGMVIGCLQGHIKGIGEPWRPPEDVSGHLLDSGGARELSEQGRFVILSNCGLRIHKQEALRNRSYMIRPL